MRYPLSVCTGPIIFLELSVKGDVAIVLVDEICPYHWGKILKECEGISHGANPSAMPARRPVIK